MEQKFREATVRYVRGVRPPMSKPVFLRTLTKSGGSRYLSVGKILPQDWTNVKVIVEYQGETHFALLIEPIR